MVNHSSFPRALLYLLVCLLNLNQSEIDTWGLFVWFSFTLHIIKQTIKQKKVLGEEVLGWNSLVGNIATAPEDLNRKPDRKIESQWRHSQPWQKSVRAIKVGGITLLSLSSLSINQSQQH